MKSHKLLCWGHHRHILWVLSTSFTFIRNKMETDWSPLQSSSHLHSLSFSITPKQLRVQQGRAPRLNNWILHNFPWKAPNTILLSSTLPKDDKGYLYLVLCAAKLSVPSRGIDRNLCTPGMGTAFAQRHHSSERPYGFMYPLSYICPLMKNCASMMFQECSSGHCYHRYRGKSK